MKEFACHFVPVLGGCVLLCCVAAYFLPSYIPRQSVRSFRLALLHLACVHRQLVPE
jgi:hypothetical protein